MLALSYGHFPIHSVVLLHACLTVPSPRMPVCMALYSFVPRHSITVLAIESRDCVSLISSMFGTCLAVFSTRQGMITRHHPRATKKFLLWLLVY